MANKLTPAEEKAKELIEWYLRAIKPFGVPYGSEGEVLNPVDILVAKQCALKVCDEKIKTIVELSEGQNGYWLDVIQKQIDIKTAINNYEQ